MLHAECLCGRATTEDHEAQVRPPPGDGVTREEELARDVVDAKDSYAAACEEVLADADEIGRSYLEALEILRCANVFGFHYM